MIGSIEWLIVMICPSQFPALHATLPVQLRFTSLVLYSAAFVARPAVVPRSLVISSLVLSGCSNLTCTE